MWFAGGRNRGDWVKGCYKENKWTRSVRMRDPQRVEKGQSFSSVPSLSIKSRRHSTVTPAPSLLSFLLRAALKEQMTTACKYDTSFHSKATETSTETVGRIAQRDPWFQTLGVPSGLSFSGFMPYPLPIFVAIMLTNAESLNFTQRPSCIIPWCLGWLYVKSANGSNKKNLAYCLFLKTCFES